MARCLPFAFYIAFLALASWLSGMPAEVRESLDLRWAYGVQIAFVIGALVFYCRDYIELSDSSLAGVADWGLSLLLGVGVFVLWINLDGGWITLGELKTSFVPLSKDGNFDWPLIAVRIFGAAAVVPIMEELFWRSFIQRWIGQKDFLLLSPSAISLRALLVTSVVFGFEHNQWLAGTIAGLAYGYLYLRCGSLWPPILAHGLTNFLLGVWVVNTGQWQFW